MIALNNPILTQHISIPKDMSSLSCEAFTAGVVEGVLDGLDFVRARFFRRSPARLRLTAAPIPLSPSLAAGKGDGARGADRAAPAPERRPHQAQPARDGARGGVQRRAAVGEGLSRTALDAPVPLSTLARCLVAQQFDSSCDDSSPAPTAYATVVSPAQRHGARSSSVASGSVLTTLAGLPTATDRAGTSLVTTEPAPIVLPSPIVTPGRMMQPPPSQQSAPMVMALAASLPVAAKHRGERASVLLL